MAKALVQSGGGFFMADSVARWRETGFQPQILSLGFWVMKGLGIFAFGLAVASPASAGPWAQGPGDWYAEATVTEEELEGLRGNRVALYGEYGFAPQWTVSAKSEAVAYEIGSQFNKEFWRATLRRQLVSHKGWAVGVEGGLVHGSSLAGVFGCDQWGAEVRLSGGLSGLRGGRNFYVFADAAVIRHEDGCTRQRAEFGYGVDIWQDFFISQQLWIERGNQTADSNKYETKLGYHFGWADLAIGYREEFAGEFDEHAVLLAVILRR
jgi:hypothetical protein